MLSAGKDSQTGGFCSSADTELIEVLSSGNGIGIDVLVAIESLIGGLHPTHFSFSSSHIRSRNIYRSTDGVLLSEFDSVLPCQLFNLVGRVFSGVDADSSLGAAVRKVYDGALDGHEAGQGLDFLNVHVFSVPGSSFGWQFVGLVLAAIGGNGLNGAVVWLKEGVPLTRGMLHLTTFSAFL